MTEPEVREYRGHQFRVETRHDGRAWTGHYCLLGIDAVEARRAAEAGRHQWTPIDPRWATRAEAERNASQAAHAAIDVISSEEGRQSV